ncbi:MAG TPA: hypothetical protein DGZ24_02570 [Rhodospirillaceae bacterium]|nr:hypothetical protein [Rhodospirillaceae bacterium]
MKCPPTYIPYVLLSLYGCPAIAKDMTLACFSRNVEAAMQIAACDSAISQGKLPDDTHALALASRGAARHQSGDITGALADYSESLLIVPDDLSVRLSRGLVREELNQIKEAEDDYSLVIKSTPLTKNVLLGKAYIRRGTLRLKNGNKSDGIADLGEARRFDPRNPLPFKTRGIYFLENDKIEQAIIELKQSVKLNAGDSYAQFMLGTAYLKLGQSDSAIKAFTDVLILEPENADALRARAITYGQQENYNAAIVDYTALLKIISTDHVSLEGRGAAFLRIGATPSAIADFDKILTLKPNDASARFLRANSRFQIGDAEGAVADFSAVLARKPSDINARLGRGIARQFISAYEDAEKDLSIILESMPDAAQPLANRGYVRVMKGDFAGATEDLTAAMALPNAPTILVLWTYIASARAGKIKPGTLAYNAQGMDPDQWPYAIMRYFMGDISGDEVISAAAENSIGATGRLCEAYFFLGQAALIVGNKAEARRLFEAALNTTAVRFTEYAGAKAELVRLGDK